MRISSCLWIILVIVLNLAPCADCPVVKDSFQTTLNQQPIGSEHQHLELCSPFCSCSCCAAPSVAPSIVALTLELKIIGPSLYLHQKTRDPIDISLPVWQPPQLI